MQEHSFRHSDSEDHDGFLENASITLIDKTDGRAATNKEDYWSSTLKTSAHFWLNGEYSDQLIPYSITNVGYGYLHPQYISGILAKHMRLLDEGIWT